MFKKIKLFFKSDNPQKNTVGISFFVLMTVFLMFGFLFLFQDESSEPFVSKDEFTAERIVEEVSRCREGSQDSYMHCFQKFFSRMLDVISLEETAKRFEKATLQSDILRLNCHQVVHAIGREAFQKTENLQTIFEEGTAFEVCAGGFFHGVIEAFFRPGNKVSDDAHITAVEMREKIPTLCDRFEELGRKNECIHGMGHGVAYILGYDIEGALTTCDILKLPERFSCYTGVFMENILAVDSTLRRVSDEDIHIPCGGYDTPKRRDPCYYVHSFRFREIGLSNEDIIRECRNASGLAGELCIRGFSIFHLAHEALAKDPQPLAEFCESLDLQDGRVCVEGIAGRLASYSRDGSHAMPFCAYVESRGLRRSCFGYAADVLRVGFDVSKKDIRDDCHTYVPSEKDCVDTI